MPQGLNETSSETCFPDRITELIGKCSKRSFSGGSYTFENFGSEVKWGEGN